LNFYRYFFNASIVYSSTLLFHGTHGPIELLYCYFNLKAAKLVERAKWIGGGVVPNLVELALVVVSRQHEERSLGREEGLIPRQEYRQLKQLYIKGKNIREWFDSGDQTDPAAR
jgi:hypothetical protein